MLSVLVAGALCSQAFGAVPKLSFDEVRMLRPMDSNFTATAGPTQYLITSLYKDAVACSGSSYQSMGIAYGSCMGGTGYSMSYANPTDDGSQIKMTMNYYTSNDCTGTPMSYPISYSTKCTNGGTVGMQYILANSATPWESLGKGVVSEQFTDNSVCTAGGSGNTFGFTPLNSCFEMTSTDNNAKSQMFLSCGTNLHYKQYTDAACQDELVDTSSAAISQCYQTPATGTGYESVVCAN